MIVTHIQQDIAEIQNTIQWIEAKDFLTNRDYVMLRDLEDRMHYLQEQLAHINSKKVA